MSDPKGAARLYHNACREAKLPILVFNFKRDGNIERAIAGHPIGTIISETA